MSSRSWEAEQEIDLGKYGRRLARRWWLLVLGLVVGGLIGWIFSSAASSDVNRAEATIYLGQPLSASGGSQVPSVQTNPAAVREIARSEEVVGEVAEQVGVDAQRLRAGISTSQISGAVARTGQPNQLFDIAVRGPWPRATVAEAPTSWPPRSSSARRPTPTPRFPPTRRASRSSTPISRRPKRVRAAH